MRPVVAIPAILLVVCTAGCVTNREDDARDLDRHVHGMPGVAGTEVRYHNDFTNGENFDLTVTLDPGITEPQVRQVGGYFVEHATGTGLAEDSAEMSLRLPVVPPPPKNSGILDYSEASFSFGRSTTVSNAGADAVADSAAVWLRTVRSPVAARVALTQPRWNGSGDSRGITVTLRPDATSAEVLAAQAADPALADASWGISLPAEPYRHPHTYYSTPRPPSDADLQTWREISAVVGGSEEARGSTTVPAERGRQAETDVEIGLPDGYGAGADARRVAFAVADLLTRFGRPVELTAQTGEGAAEVVVGGCYRHDADHVALPLERELSQRYETC
ncbi:hypothetical protein O6P37_22775 [Mycobacterium sp. CPCC 205372]|uniref:Uncharacterized protein n=1 Tax=Mycobacterium hippophais TaxID=3016340 RepID=A0ABT4PYM9_9MYCO|nr:hypothetical protein [Mycobacterium hippophais]MCZ8381700.1 hypothetical protein [Mycobacterium hippophais]